MWLGRKILGEWLRIPVRSLDASRDEIAPTTAPTYSIYPNSETVISTANDVTMPALAVGTLTGWHQAEHLLDSGFSAGRHVVLVEYASAGHTGTEEHSFEIVAGGNNKGAYIALAHYRTPHADFIVGQLDDGTTEFRKNPSI